MSLEGCNINEERAGVGAGLRDVFYNMGELRPMKYKETMTVDHEGWTKAVCEEHKKMLENRVWCPVKKKDIPRNAEILTLTWACKLNSKRTKHAQINGQGYK